MDVGFVRAASSSCKSYSAHAFTVPVPPRPLTGLPNLDVVHMSSEPSIPSIPVIGQDTSQQYMSASYRAAGECIKGKQPYTLMLSSELANESSQIHIRNTAALALKNNLSAHIQYTTRWLSLDNDTKAKIKQEVLVTLASPLLRAGGFAPASVEFPHDQWPDLIELVLLLSFVNNLTNTNLRIVTLQTIGYICESIKPEILSLRSNEILTAVICGVRHPEPSGVQLAAVHSLYNSLEFVHENFEWRVQSHNAGYHGPYYDKMASYMEQAVFVTADYGEPPEVESKFFAKIALPEVNPVLLSLLTLQEEVVNENEWNMSMSVGTYFNFMAWAVTDPIVDAVSQALPLLMGMTSDSNVHVKDMVAWTLGRIHGLLIATIKPDAHLHPLVPALVTGIQDNLRTLEFLEEESVPSQTSHLSPYFDGIVNTLLRVTDIHPEHIDNYFDVGAATSRNAVRATVVLQLPDKPPDFHCFRRRISGGRVVSFRLSCNFYWYGSDSSIDLHAPLLHLMPGYHMPNDSYAGHTPMQVQLLMLLILHEQHAVKKVPVAEEDSDDSSTDDGGEDDSFDKGFFSVDWHSQTNLNKGKNNGINVLLCLSLPYYLSMKVLAVPRQDKISFCETCFCHKNIIDVGFICSLSSSIPRMTEAANHSNLHLSGLPGLHVIHVFPEPSISSIPVIEQDTSQHLGSEKRPLSSSKTKQQVLVILASPLSRAGGFFSQVIIAIASVEFPHDQWPGLIELLSFMNNLTNTNLGIATLQMIGYICESIKPEILSLRSNKILTAMIRGARQHEPPSGVQLAAVHALYNSLEFVHENFEWRAQSHNTGFYHDGFWTTVCEEGIELAHEACKAADYGELPKVESKFFAKIALPEVNPVLLSLLTFQEDVVDKDEQNVSMSVSTCFNFMARAVTDPIVDAVIPFIEAYIKSPNWHQREVGMMAFGSIRRANLFVGSAPPPVAMGQPPSTSGVGQSLGQSPQQMQQMQRQHLGPRLTSRAGYPGIGMTSLAASAPSPACGTSPGHGIGLGTVQLYGKANEALLWRDGSRKWF
ncbi:armadillo-type protein [Pisolithus sp. B1]|nr:armadillo-type protein [Pisolithus sp. B1]